MLIAPWVPPDGARPGDQVKPWRLEEGSAGIALYPIAVLVGISLALIISHIVTQKQLAND
jgi:hypothetical protein